MIFQAGPTRVIVDDEQQGHRRRVHPHAARARRTPRGRRRPEPAPGTEFVIECDRVLLAIGQGPDLTWIGPGNEGVDGQPLPARGRRGHVRDRPARRLRHRRRPDRRRAPWSRPSPKAGAAPTPWTRSCKGKDLSELRNRQTLAEVEPTFLSIVPVHRRAQGSAPPPQVDAGEGARPRATSSTRSRYTAAEVMAESTRCLQCTCEALGNCDLRRLGIEYGTTLPDPRAGPRPGRRASAA